MPTPRFARSFVTQPRSFSVILRSAVRGHPTLSLRSNCGKDTYSSPPCTTGAMTSGRVSPRVNRAATRASRLPRLRLGRHAHSSAPWPISSCVGFACRLASIARRRALRASLGFASAATLIPRLLGRSRRCVRVCVSPRVNRAATRASRLPRLRLGRHAHSSAPWPISSCVGFACRLASIARRRALRASLGFASAATLIPRLLGRSRPASGFACRLASIARRRALRASLGFASAATLIPP